MDDKELWRRIEQYRSMEPGYYGALLGLAGVSRRSARFFRIGKPRWTGLPMREKLSRALRLIDDGKIEFVRVKEINPATNRPYNGRSKLVAAFKETRAIDVKPPMRYANQALKQIEAQGRGHPHLSLPPLPVRGRLFR